ncbi:MAG: hypothetical protein ACK5L3_03145 [Oscillospiraceae bacterium]
MDSFVELVVRQVLGSAGAPTAGSGKPTATAPAAPARPNYQQQAAQRRQLLQPGAPAAPKQAAAKPPAAPAAPLPTASFFTQRLSAALPAPPKAAAPAGAEKPFSLSPSAAEPRPCCGNCKGCGGLFHLGGAARKPEKEGGGGGAPVHGPGQCGAGGQNGVGGKQLRKGAGGGFTNGGVLAVF